MNKTIILDFDGTLIDTERVMMHSVMEYAEAHGLPQTEDFMLQFVGVCPKDIVELLWQKYGRDFDAVGFLTGAVGYFNKTLVTKPTPLMDGAKELLDYLKDSGWRMALATTTQKNIVDFELDYYDIRKYFEVIVTGDTVEHNKPSPEIYLKTLGLLGVDAKDCYAVEDSTVGIQSATTAGLKVVAIPDLHEVREDLQPKCVAICKDRFDAINYFRNNN